MFKVLYKHIQRIIEVNFWRHSSFLFMEHYVAGTVQLTVSSTTSWIHLNSWPYHCHHTKKLFHNNQWLICPFRCSRIIWFLCLHGNNQRSSCTNVKGEWWKHWAPPSCLQNLGKGQKIIQCLEVRKTDSQHKNKWIRHKKSCTFHQTSSILNWFWNYSMWFSLLTGN